MAKKLSSQQNQRSGDRGTAFVLAAIQKLELIKASTPMYTFWNLSTSPHHDPPVLR